MKATEAKLLDFLKKSLQFVSRSTSASIAGVRRSAALGAKGVRTRRRGLIGKPTKLCWSSISRITRPRGPRWRSSGKCSPHNRAVKSKFCCVSW